MLRQVGKLLLSRCQVQNQITATSGQLMSSKANSDSESQLIRGHEKCINQVSLLGRVGTEPQKRGNDEHPVITFALATNSRYESPVGELVTKTDWHRISVFKPTLRDTVYSYLKKGQRVLVTGRLSYGEIKDEEGNPRRTVSVIADDIIFFQSYE